ncbi:Protein of unknown function [Micromonospora citrea]|uniref:DUF3263 domain-containing protein n=1 Tax=Micromonospora citrea TaxID=47855 RepID=A0A1C6V958_9ACTN|nr:DUF3263 domain-containing protein [Micromonospora citrea]SCL62891.1 Protein of unknown function [Micromonospora citrea]
MQPADAAPAAPEPSTADRAAATGEARDAGGVVPQPRTGPDAAVPTVPQPRSAAETAVGHAGAATPEAADTALGGAGAATPETDPATGDRPDGGLTERERGILAFEQQWWRHAGAKEQAIRDSFGLSATRYYQLLNALLDNPAALAADPVLVGRLRRLRSSRARNRRR